MNLNEALQTVYGKEPDDPEIQEIHKQLLKGNKATLNNVETLYGRQAQAHQHDRHDIRLDMKTAVTRLFKTTGDISEISKNLSAGNDKTLKEVNSQYRYLARTHHPDRGGDSEAFGKLSEANEFISKEVEFKKLGKAIEFIRNLNAFESKSQSSMGPKRNYGNGPNWSRRQPSSKPNRAEKEACGLQKEQSKQSYQESAKAAFQDQLKTGYQQ